MSDYLPYHLKLGSDLYYLREVVPDLSLTLITPPFCIRLGVSPLCPRQPEIALLVTDLHH